MTRTVRIITASGLNIYAKPSPIASGTWAADVIAFTPNPNDGREYSATIGDGPHVAFVRAGGSPLATDRARWTFDAVDAGVATLLTRIVGTLASGTHQPQTGDSFARLGAPEGESIAADIAAIDGGGVVNVLPAVGIVADRSPGATITPVVGETISQSITLYATDGTTPINLSGKTLAIVFETLQGVDVAVVASSSITISGADNNVVSFAYPLAVTASERTLRFAIRDAAAPLTMYLQGLCNVTRAPQVD